MNWCFIARFILALSVIITGAWADLQGSNNSCNYSLPDSSLEIFSEVLKQKNENSPTLFVIIHNNKENSKLNHISHATSRSYMTIQSYDFNKYIDNLHTIIPNILKQSTNIQFIALISCDELLDILNKITELFLESRNYKWIYPCSKLEFKQLGLFVKDNHIIETFSRSSGGNYVLRYWDIDGGMVSQKQSIVFDAANKSNSTYNEYSNLENKQRKLNLKGKILQIAVVDNWPFFGLRKTGENYVPDVGIDVSVLETLAEVFNFRIKILSPEDEQWGGPQPDGNISGMIGMVARGETELAIDEITITDLRETVADFSYPYYMEASIILTKAPQPASNALAVFLPFPTAVWLLLLLVILSYGPFLWFFRSYVSIYEENKKYISMVEFVMNSLQSMTMQGTSLQLYSWSLRFLLITFYAYGLLIHALYAGTLTAVLAAPPYEKPIDSLEQLIKNDDVIPIVTSGSSIHGLMEVATEGIYKELYDSMDPKHSFGDLYETTLPKVLKGGFALLEARLGTEIRAKVIDSEAFYISRESFYPQAYGIAFKRGCPLLGPFNESLLRFLQAGLIDKWKNDQLRKVSSTSKSKQTSATSDKGSTAMSISQLQGAFFLIILGYILAIITASAEWFLHKVFSNS